MRQDDILDLSLDEEIPQRDRKPKRGGKHDRTAGWIKYVSWVLMAVQLVLAVIVFVQLQKMDILPAKYYVIYVVAIFVVNALTFVSTRKIWSAVLMWLLSIAVSVVLIFGYRALVKIDQTVQNVTPPQPQETDTQEEPVIEQVTKMAILVLTDSTAEEITDLSQFAIGYRAGEEEEALAKIKEEIKAEAGDVSFVEFDDVEKLAEALYNRTIPAIVMDEAYIGAMDDLEGYTTFSKDTKIIFSSDIVRYINLVSEKETNLDSFIVYFSGIDTFGGVNATSRSDVNILAVVNTKTKHIQLLNTPRDYYVPMPNSDGVRDKLTHAGIYGVDNSIGTLEMLYGIHVEYFVRMNFSGFEDIIDNLGGIDVYSEFDFTVEPIKHYTVGINHLSGIEALAFARERHSFASGDIQRGKNQMAVITAMVNKMSSVDMLYNYAKVLDSISDSFQTNMTSEEVYALVKMQLADMSAWTVDTHTVIGSNGKDITFSMPRTKTDVMFPIDSEVARGKELLEEVLNER